jgi:hypothetical protein
MFRCRRWLSDATSISARLSASATATSQRKARADPHVVHAAEHAVICGLGDQQFVGPQIAEDIGGQALGEKRIGQR